MSWMKRQGSAAPPGSEQQAFTSPQPYGNQQNMFPTYQGPPAGHQQQTWQMPQQQQQYNQQYGQVYQQQPFVNNASQYFQQPQQQYNQNYVNHNFDNVQPAINQTYQQNYNHNQTSQQQSFTQNEGNVDGWEDNWGWGWDDTSKQYQKSVNQSAAPQPACQPQIFNNSNVIEESFAPTNSWNWSMEDKKETEVAQSMQTHQQNQRESLHVENVVNDDSNIFNEPTQGNGNNVLEQENPDKVKNLSDKEAVKEQLPNLALGKRLNLENLTPQWSIESQMSQDSSDGPHTQSEGTYRSENQSRNSSKCSPGPNTDSTYFNYPQSGLNEMSISNSEWSKQTNDGSNRTSSVQSNNRSESYDELANSVKEMNIGNHEHIPVGGQQSSHNIENIQEIELVRAPEPSVSPISLSNQLIPQAMPPPPPVTSQHVQNSHSPITSQGNAVPQSLPPMNIPTSSHVTAANLPPPPTSMPLLPPSNFSTSSTQNPFKSGAPFSHKSIAKTPANPHSQSFSPPQVPGANLTSPTVVNKVVQQDRLSGSFGANLETTPDNSERPDQPQVTSYRSMAIPPQVPDNLEVAPQNDRNEYLQTAHLSSSDYGENTDFSRNIPPPGLRRMGVGQQEGEYNQSLNISGDEPPPGLARMVPGQQTETGNSYNQATDDYMDRQIDGQPTDSSGRPYRQAEGQQIADNYTSSVAPRGGDRRPVGLDRMVPGEPSNDEYPQYPTSNFASANEHRVVTGVDHDYPVSTDTSRNDIREQNVDGSDYTEPPPRNPSRSVIGAREASNATSPDFSLSVDDQQREITMEGENLQDLSVISYDVTNANVVEVAKDRSHDAADAIEYPNNSRRQSLSRVTSGEDSERDRAFKASPRKDKQKSRERDREREKDRGRYSRGDKKYESERRSARDDRRDRRERDASPELARQSRHRRSTRSHRYETEDTDYYSDRDRDRRHYREGSYTSSKPPRGEDKDRRHEDRERRRYNTIERERRYEEERSRRSDRHRDRDRDRDRDRNPDRFDRRYRDIDPRKFSSLRGDREDDDRRKGETYSSGSRAGSREAAATDEDGVEPRRRRRHRQHHYYEGYGAADAGAADAGARGAQRRQYEYYERLRRADPAAYVRVYNQLLHPGLYAADLYDGYGALGYEARAEERGSVHSGRSSANGLKPADTYRARAASLRTDASDRELTTDMSLNLHLEESTVRSERMTPFKYSTAHVKGVVCGESLLVVPARYPVDARAAPLRLLPLRALLPASPLAHAPGPLVKGVTHKKSVVEYCEAQARAGAGAGDAGAAGARDGAGWALLWELLALLLRQNGVVMGSDIAELLMKNTKEFEYKPPPAKSTDYRRDSEASSDMEGEPAAPAAELVPKEEEVKKPAVSEQEALERFREYLIYGNRQEALEWAMSCGLWGHALQLAAAGARRERAAAGARFVAALSPADPLHSLYAALAQRAPPAATCVADERWGDWRPHAAIILSNASTKPEQDRRTLTQLGDSLNARGLLYSAQFCYLSAGVPFAAHPLAPHRAPPAPAGAAPAPAPAPAGAAPPRLSLLLADPRAESLAHFATDHAIFATEIYEYAMSLNQDFVLDELVVYKLVAAARLADAGRGARALRYAEAAARALTAAPRRHAASLARALAALADRLKYFDPALQEEGAAGAEGAEGEGEAEGEGSAGGSPRHQQWLRDVHAVALQLSAEASQQNTPQHHSEPIASWADQTLQQTEQVPQYSEPVEDTTDYSHYYQQQNHQLQQQQFHEQHQHLQQQQLQQVPEHAPEQQYDQQYGYEEHAQSYADPYWQNDTHYGYDGAAAAEEAPTITMPGARSAPALFADDDRPASADPDRDTDTPRTNGKKAETKSSDGGKDKKSGWLGGILTKLSLRAPNQMILPDDTNPTIVWDEEHKRWRDLAASDAAPAPPPPPPVMSTSTPLQSPGAPPPVPAAPGPPAAPGAPGAPAAPAANIFKMQKSRHIKKSYVDVLNPGGGAPSPAPAPLAPPAPPAPLAPPAPGSYFVPAPHHDQFSPPPVHVSMPPSPAASPRAAPALAPAPATATLPPEGGIYDPTQVASTDDFRSGI